MDCWRQAKVDKSKGTAWARTPLQAHTVQLPVERFALDAQDLRGTAFVAAGSRQHTPDLLGFGVGERISRVLPRLRQLDRASDGRLVDAAVGSEDREPLHHVLELPHISRPAIDFKRF